MAYVYRPRVAIIDDVFELTRLRLTPTLRISRLTRLRPRLVNKTKTKNKDPRLRFKVNFVVL